MSDSNLSARTKKQLVEIAVEREVMGKARASRMTKADLLEAITDATAAEAGVNDPSPELEAATTEAEPAGPQIDRLAGRTVLLRDGDTIVAGLVAGRSSKGAEGDQPLVDVYLLPQDGKGPVFRGRVPLVQENPVKAPNGSCALLVR